MDIIISPIHETFFMGRIHDGLGIDQIASWLSDEYGYRVKIIDFSVAASDYSLIPQRACWFYTPSYDERYNRYIRDVILDFVRSRNDVILIPDLDELFSYENKGYQELYKKRLGIEHIRGRYFGDRTDFVPNKEFHYPFVFKKINGAVSSGVRLIRTPHELDSLARKEARQTFIEKLRFYKRVVKRKLKRIRPKDERCAVNFIRFFTKRAPFVVQEFIPDLDHDYKVLVFGEKYYVMKRWVRTNDFRASGSGKFEHITPPSGLLDYAEEISQKLDTPFCALDIAYTSAYCALIEFQGIGFGPTTLKGSSFYHVKTQNKWSKIEATSDLEKEYADAIHGFLVRRLRQEA